MSIKRYRKNAAGRRQMSVDAFEDITKSKPEKSLTIIRNRTGGRNNQGKLTVRHRGGGAKRRCRIIDFQRQKFDLPAKVIAIEYDPNRSARLALLQYGDGVKAYMVAPQELKVGDEVISSKGKVDIKPGNQTILENIPQGLFIYNVERVPGKGAELGRSAGASIQLMNIEGDYAQLKMPSDEIRLVPKICLATIGQVSNPDHQHIKIGKAGRKRHMGIRPTVRGKAMNPVDHPHGGGEGKHPIGLTHPKTPWGKPALGVRTRRPGKQSDRLIMKRRHSGR